LALPIGARPGHDKGSKTSLRTQNRFGCDPGASCVQRAGPGACRPVPPCSNSASFCRSSAS
jgi:hypothetical protein